MENSYFSRLALITFLSATVTLPAAFAMLESELQGVLNALRRAGSNIVAIHNHMAGEEPRHGFLHYWGKGAAASLAKGLKAALDTQRK